jgi:hypothetical protein
MTSRWRRFGGERQVARTVTEHGTWIGGTSGSEFAHGLGGNRGAMPYRSAIGRGGRVGWGSVVGAGCGALSATALELLVDGAGPRAVSVSGSATGSAGGVLSAGDVSTVGTTATGESGSGTGGGALSHPTPCNAVITVAAIHAAPARFLARAQKGQASDSRTWRRQVVQGVNITISVR